MKNKRTEQGDFHAISAMIESGQYSHYETYMTMVGQFGERWGFGEKHSDLISKIKAKFNLE